MNQPPDNPIGLHAPRPARAPWWSRSGIAAVVIALSMLLGSRVPLLSAMTYNTFVSEMGGSPALQSAMSVVSIAIVAVVLFFGHSLLALFDATPEVISVGYTRLVMVFSAYTFSMLYEVMSGYLRGFGISLVPALLTVIGVVGVRITWIAFVFPAHRTFEAIMIVYPISLAATAVLIGIALLCYRPSKRFAVKP